MKLEQIDPINSPQHFFMPRIDGENTIYDQIAEDTSSANDCIRSLKKKVHSGDAEFLMYADHIEIRYNGVKVAGADLVAEYHTNTWQSVNFDFSSANITKVDDGTFRFVMVQGDNTFGLEWSFAQGIQTKQTFYLDIPGRDVRIKWRTEVLENALAINREDNKGLKYSVDDYEGEIEHTTPVHPDDGWSYHIWTFEPDGYSCDIVDSRTALQRYTDQAGLMVDPYLDIDEQSSYIDVTCDGYILRIYDSSSGFVQCYNADGSTALWNVEPWLQTSVGRYYARYDDNRTLSLLSNELTFAKISVSGNWDNDYGSGEDYLANSTGYTYTFTVYSDRVSVEIKQVNSGTITFTSAANPLMYINNVNLTSSSGIYENSPIESAPSAYNSYNSSDYLAVLSDEVNVVVLNPFNDFTGGITVNQYFGSSLDEPQLALNSNTLLTGTHIFCVEIIIDSVEREHGSKLYALSDRLEMGEQYVDTTLSLTTGSVTTTNTGATAIESSGFFSDGAWHFQGASNDNPVKLTWDRTRHNPKLIYQTNSGSSTTPTMEVGGSSVTLYDPAAAAYNSARYYLEDITTTAQNTAGVKNWLITMPADSEVTSSTIWEINPSSGSTLSPNNMGHSQALDAFAITQKNTLTAADLAQAMSLDTPTLTIVVNLIVQGLNQTQTLDALGLVQKHNLLVANLSQAQTIDNITLSIANLLVLANLIHSHSLSGADLIQKHNLNVDDLTQAQIIDVLDLVQQHNLVVSELTQTQTISNVTLSFADLLVIADLIHSQGIDNVDVTQAHNLIVNNLFHSNTLDSANLSLALLLEVAGLSHVHNIDALSITYVNVLAIDNLGHSHDLGSMSLTQAHELLINDLQHNHSLDLVSFSSDDGVIVITFTQQVRVFDFIQAQRIIDFIQESK